MPTRYWLVGRQAKLAVDRLEASGGVSAASAAVNPVELQLAHERYAAERDASIPVGWNGPRPFGGVGGHAAWRQMPARTLRLVPRGRRRPGRPLGGSPTGGGRRNVAREQGPTKACGWHVANFAAVDCGTLSTRLLVSRPTGEPIVRLMRITGLGEGVDRSRALLPEAIERTLVVLGEYRELMDQYDVRAARMVGTSALRDASNRASFSRAAEETRRYPSYPAERRRGGLFVVPRRHRRTERARAAIGSSRTSEGGRLSSSWGRSVPEGRSLDIGCVRVTERFFITTLRPPTSWLAAGAWLGEQYQRGRGRPASVALGRGPHRLGRDGLRPGLLSTRGSRRMTTRRCTITGCRGRPWIGRSREPGRPPRVTDGQVYPVSRPAEPR